MRSRTNEPSRAVPGLKRDAIEPAIGDHGFEHGAIRGEAPSRGRVRQKDNAGEPGSSFGQSCRFLDPSDAQVGLTPP